MFSFFGSGVQGALRRGAYLGLSGPGVRSPGAALVASPAQIALIVSSCANPSGVAALALLA